jgi:rfaE bifunctional protein nucleotidyltransferase chain/domain/rfaE bifunctional protein kinase chain/domain
VSPSPASSGTSGDDPRPGHPAHRAAQDWLAGHEAELAAVVAGLRRDAATLDRWGAHLARVLGGGGRLLAAGNGGSAAEAQHLTAELVGRFVAERRPLSAIALHAESSSVTAIGNDYGAEEVFARQVAAHGRPGDVLVLLSASGRSENVLRAAHRARALGLSVWALTGPGPNPLVGAADEAVAVDGPTTSSVQTGHLVALHALCTALDAHLLAGGTGGGVGEPPGGPVAQAPARRPAPGAEPPAGPAPSAAPPPGPAPAAGAARRRRRVVVVGDLVLDRDLLGRTDRVSPDAPVPVVDLLETVETPGGAGLTALLCATGDVDVELLAPVADDEAGGRLAAALDAGGVRLRRLGHEGATRTKTRVRVAGQSLVRLDEGGPGTPQGAGAEHVAAVLAGADVVLVSDYGGGATRDDALREALAMVARRVPVVWDPHPRGGAPVPGCALVTPNLAEAVSATGGGAPGAARPDEVATALAARWRARGVCVTAGAQGAWLGAPGSEPLFVPAPVVAGGDPCGAGDRFAASAALALAAGAVPSEAVAAAVRDASAWVAAGGVTGWRAAQRAGAERASGDDLDAVLARVRATGGTLVATGGCFDVLHAGHVACLEAARRLGDALVVLLNGDGSVRRLKGPGRPVSSQDDRASVLRALDSVDAVVVFDEDDPRAALASLRPDVWAKGGDYGGAELPEAALVRGWGGRVVLLPYLDGRSTTQILARGARPAGATAPVDLTTPTDLEVS